MIMGRTPVRPIFYCSHTRVILSAGEAGVEESTHYRFKSDLFGAKILRLPLVAQDDKMFGMM